MLWKADLNVLDLALYGWGMETDWRFLFIFITSKGPVILHLNCQILWCGYMTKVLVSPLPSPFSLSFPLQRSSSWAYSLYALGLVPRHLCLLVELCWKRQFPSEYYWEHEQAPAWRTTSLPRSPGNGAQQISYLKAESRQYFVSILSHSHLICRYLKSSNELTAGHVIPDALEWIPAQCLLVPCCQDVELDPGLLLTCWGVPRAES